MSDDPMEPVPSGGMFRNVVIDLAEVQIQHGRTPYKVRRCEHCRVFYSQSERRVWCRDCEQTVDPFDAFKMLASRFHEMLSAAERKMTKADEALKKTARLRATKELDRMWSGHQMAPSCPHCGGGLLPEDFADGAASAVSREIEEARRRAAAKRKAEERSG
jgi:hypothetical protein